MTFTQTGYTDLLSENEARNELILSELAQVYYLARRIHERLPQHVPLEDLVHAGVLGLIEAVRKYNPSKNASLKSFASFRIRGAILDSLRALDWGSRPLRKKGRNVAESITRLANKLGRQPTEDEVAADLDLEVSELHTLLRRLDGLHIVGQMVGSRFDDSETQDLIESAPADENESPFEICLALRKKRLPDSGHQDAFRKRAAGHFPLLPRRADHAGGRGSNGPGRIAGVTDSLAGHHQASCCHPADATRRGHLQVTLWRLPLKHHPGRRKLRPRQPAVMRPEQVQPCDFRLVGGVDQARLAPLVIATESFAPRFSQALHSRLGLTCETTLQSSEQMPCQRFLARWTVRIWSPCKSDRNWGRRPKRRCCRLTPCCCFQWWIGCSEAAVVRVTLRAKSLRSKIRLPKTSCARFVRTATRMAEFQRCGVDGNATTARSAENIFCQR